MDPIEAHRKQDSRRQQRDFVGLHLSQPSIYRSFCILAFPGRSSWRGRSRCSLSGGTSWSSSSPLAEKAGPRCGKGERVPGSESLKRVNEHSMPNLFASCRSQTTVLTLGLGLLAAGGCLILGAKHLEISRRAPTGPSRSVLNC
jgi:hypothetical protein